MADFLLFLSSVMVLRGMWLFLRGAFALIEKAHEHLRESDRLRGDGELVKGSVI